MKVKVKPFITILKRAVKSKFNQLFMTNHLLLQCYDIDEDSDVGFHYVLGIPYSEDYDSEFYDMQVLLNPSKILSLYSNGHGKMEEVRKLNGIKPKSVNEELKVEVKDQELKFTFLFYLDENLITTEVYSTEYPIDPTNIKMNNCIKTYDRFVQLLKIGGACIIIDGNRTGLFDRVLNSIQVYYHIIKINGVKIKIPLMRSMLLTKTECEKFLISIQQTKLQDIYMYTIQLTRNGISEYFIGYIQNF